MAEVAAEVAVEAAGEIAAERATRAAGTRTPPMSGARRAGEERMKDELRGEATA
ncbi:hypothetical protein A33K_13542 [Burkholderia humptydooensis MSMB43]|uniref:Uncharacterized protein n=1 Tax=Burkholderia humptydooensis MSMB43 TaxID=441157 RepID=A0ABN0GCG7_9BURK|nr:hypothetical protein A33K_13542 [Burkholderia humptydooensis MSMB43]